MKPDGFWETWGGRRDKKGDATEVLPGFCHYSAKLARLHSELLSRTLEQWLCRRDEQQDQVAQAPWVRVYQLRPLSAAGSGRVWPLTPLKTNEPNLIRGRHRLKMNRPYFLYKLLDLIYTGLRETEEILAVAYGSRRSAPRGTSRIESVDRPAFEIQRKARNESATVCFRRHCPRHGFAVDPAASSHARCCTGTYPFQNCNESIDQK